MRNIHERFTVYVTDDIRPDSFTKWKQLGIAVTRAQAWQLNQKALGPKGYRYSKIIETRIYKGRD